MTRRDGSRDEYPLEESARCGSIRPLADVDAHDLAVLIDGSTAVRPACLQSASVGTGGVVEERQEALHLSVDSAPIPDAAALREPCDVVGVTETKAHVPTTSECDQGVRDVAPRAPLYGAGGEPSAARTTASAHRVVSG